MKQSTTITSRVKALMLREKVTVAGMMAQTGLSNETIMRARDYRIGCCSLKTLATIAAALGVKIKDLFDED